MQALFRKAPDTFKLFETRYESIFREETKGRFRKRVASSFRGNMGTYPRSGFPFRGNIRPNHPFDVNEPPF